MMWIIRYKSQSSLLNLRVKEFHQVFHVDYKEINLIFPSFIYRW
jgi:hypothetical protein